MEVTVSLEQHLWPPFYVTMGCTLARTRNLLCYKLAIAANSAEYTGLAIELLPHLGVYGSLWVCWQLISCCSFGIRVFLSLCHCCVARWLVWPMSLQSFPNLILQDSCNHPSLQFWMFSDVLWSTVTSKCQLIWLDTVSKRTQQSTGI